jgi:hypothetical protein
MLSWRLDLFDQAAISTYIHYIIIFCCVRVTLVDLYMELNPGSQFYMEYWAKEVMYATQQLQNMQVLQMWHTLSNGSGKIHGKIFLTQR